MIASPAQLTPQTPAENHPNSPEKPTLSPHESTLLATLQSLRFDPFAFAEKATPEDLLLFLTSPAIHAHLALFQAFAQQALSLRILQAQAAAISHLEQVASTTPSPIEKRRAASTPSSAA